MTPGAFGGLRLATILLLASSSVGSALAVDVDESLRVGDAWWHRRSENHNGELPDGKPIAAAVDAYTQALNAAPHHLEARWKLLRALYFQADYAALERQAKLEILDRSRALADEGLDQIAERVGGRERLDGMSPEELGAAFSGDAEVAEIYFWSAVHWGLWGRERGKFAAARQGVAKKIRDYCEVVNRVEERIENGGGHRVLGRLHYEAPKIPLITGWVSRKDSIAELRRAHELAPSDLLTRLYLGEALHEHGKGEVRGEAMTLLRSVVEAEAEGEYAVENLRTISLAERALVQATE